MLSKPVIKPVVACALLATCCISTLPSARRSKPSATVTSTDWSVAVTESTMKRYPTAESLKGWGYAKSLYLYGVYLVYLRTKDPRYLDYIKLRKGYLDLR
jgi:rhamnogalacturonyl hydrolase YesR